MPGPSVYPNAIDGYAQLPLVIDQVTPVNAYSVNTLRSAIINIEEELGISPKGTYEDVRARLDALEAAIAALGGGTSLDGDTIEIDFIPSTYSRNTSTPEVNSVTQLTAHLNGIDSELDDIYELLTNISDTADAHADRHIISGADQIDGDNLHIDFIPSNYTRDNSPVEVSSQNALTSHLKGIDNAIGAGSGITLPGTTTENNIVVWGPGSPTFKNTNVTLDTSDNISGVNTLEVGSQTFWGALSANPTTTAAGDMYFNTVIGMMMYYDSLRSKWLSLESATFLFGRNGNTKGGQYYRGVDGRVFTSTIGYYALRNGTVVSITYTKSDSNASDIEITENGTQITTMDSGATSGRDLNTNADFAFGSVLGVRNLTGSDITSDVQGWIRIKWRT